MTGSLIICALYVCSGFKFDMNLLVFLLYRVDCSEIGCVCFGWLLDVFLELFDYFILSEAY